MCYNYKVSKCHVSLLIMSILLVIFSAGGTTDDTDQQVIGDLNLRDFSIIILIWDVFYFYILCVMFVQRNNLLMVF